LPLVCFGIAFFLFVFLNDSAFSGSGFSREGVS